MQGNPQFHFGLGRGPKKLTLKTESPKAFSRKTTAHKKPFFSNAFFLRYLKENESNLFKIPQIDC